MLRGAEEMESLHLSGTAFLFGGGGTSLHFTLAPARGMTGKEWPTLARSTFRFLMSGGRFKQGCITFIGRSWHKCYTQKRWFKKEKRG